MHSHGCPAEGSQLVRPGPAIQNLRRPHLDWDPSNDIAKLDFVVNIVCLDRLSDDFSSILTLTVNLKLVLGC